jgi:hypothetical protein
MVKLAARRVTYLVLLTLISFRIQSQSQPLHEYYFNGNLASTSGGPTLIENLSCAAGPGSFTSLFLVSSLGICTISNSYCFNEGGGLQYNNPNYITDQYTIHVFCKFNNTIGKFRLLDFSESNADPGIYIQNNCLNIAPAGNVGTCPFLFTSNQFYLFTFVRDASSDMLTVYVDGAIFGVFNDAAKMYTLSTPTTPLVFFRDDNVNPCEAKSGCIKYACVTAQPMSLVQVVTTWLNLCPAILPINLSHFEAINENDKVLLNWKTENDNTARFDIERSTDAKHYIKIGEVNQTYPGVFNYYDNFPETGINYYRLKQVDKTSQEEYSPVAQVKFEKKSPDFYPNPADMTLMINPNFNGSRISIKNMLGIEVMCSDNEFINTSALTEGWYLLFIGENSYPLLVKH